MPQGVPVQVRLRAPIPPRKGNSPSPKGDPAPVAQRNESTALRRRGSQVRVLPGAPIHDQDDQHERKDHAFIDCRRPPGRSSARLIEGKPFPALAQWSERPAVDRNIQVRFPGAGPTSFTTTSAGSSKGQDATLSRWRCRVRVPHRLPEFTRFTQAASAANTCPDGGNVKRYPARRLSAAAWPRCPGGGTGRHTILRGWRRKACGFESRPGHQLRCCM